MGEGRGVMLLTDEIRGFIGMESAEEVLCEPVEPGAVRRYVQATMDDDPIYSPASTATRYGGAVAPLLFPAFMARREWGSADPFAGRDADFDGFSGFGGERLPELPLNLALLNGGLEVEFFRCARHGEAVTQKSRYVDIHERVSRGQPILFVITETEYRAKGADLLMRVKRTMIRR